MQKEIYIYFLTYKDIENMIHFGVKNKQFLDLKCIYFCQCNILCFVMRDPTSETNL